MEVSFSNAKMCKICSSEKQLRSNYGPRMAALVAQRLLELQAAETLEDLKSLPAMQCHELKGKLAGYLAIDLVHPQRLVFKPAHEPVPRLDEGGLDWSQVKAIEVFRIGDYH